MTFDEKVEFFGKHPFIPTILVGHEINKKSSTDRVVIVEQMKKADISETF